MELHQVDSNNIPIFLYAKNDGAQQKRFTIVNRWEVKSKDDSPSIEISHGGKEIGIQLNDDGSITIGAFYSGSIDPVIALEGDFPGEVKFL